MKYIISLVLGYLFGCFQTSYFLGKLVKGIDIRDHGVNNAGASNTVMVLGFKYGLLVAILDILKATFAVLIIKRFYPNMPNVWYLTGLGAFLGHCFPFFMQFRGGKGTASLVGAALAIDIRVGLITMLSGMVVAIITDYIFIGTLTVLSMFAISSIFYDYGTFSLVIAIIVAVISLAKHSNNIVRLIKGEETHVSNHLTFLKRKK
ncbi:MAG: glycerol-3-phosphate acyltransferase [Clostridia bacterium]